MERRVLVAVVLVLVVAVAGCSTILGEGGLTGTPTAETVDPATVSYADGYSADGIDDGEAAAAAHREAVLSHESYSIQYDAVVVTDDEEQNVSATYAVEIDEEESLQQLEIGAAETWTTVDRYQAAERLYIRTDGSEFEEPQVDAYEQAFDPEGLTGVEFVSALLSHADYGAPTVVERDGSLEIRYETDDIETAEPFVGAEDRENVTAFDAMIVVDEAGVIHRASYDIELATADGDRRVTVEFRTFDYDATTVEQPDWVDED